MKDAPISFRIERQLKEALERLATADSRSLSSMIELILKRYVEAAERAKRRRE